MRWASAVVALLIVVVTQDAMAATRSVVIGDIVIRYDDTRFRLLPPPSPSAGDGGGQHLRFVCIARPDCFDAAILAVTAVPAGDPEEPGFLAPDWIDEPRDLWGDGLGLLSPGGTMRNFGGLDLTGTMTHSRCRSAGGIRFEATGVLDKTRYVFSAGHPTCGGGPQGIPQAMFEELLAGIAVLPTPR